MNQNPVRTRSGRTVRRPKVHFESAVQFAPPAPRTPPRKPDLVPIVPIPKEMNGIPSRDPSENRNEEDPSDGASALPAASSSSPISRGAAVTATGDGDHSAQTEDESQESAPAVAVAPPQVAAEKDVVDECACKKSGRNLLRLSQRVQQDLDQVQKERQKLLDERRAFEVDMKQASEEYRRFREERRLLQDERQRVQDERQRFQDDRQRLQDDRTREREELGRLRTDLKRARESVDQSRGDGLSSGNKADEDVSRHAAKRPRSA